MGSCETLCLRWNDFECGIKEGFSQLRREESFYDVTLACGEDQIKAHKVILATYSPFFKSLLRSLPHQHPLLYLRGIRFSHLESVLSFMYQGEVRVKPEDLDEFLAVAQDLQVNGLASNTQNSNESRKNSAREGIRRPPIKKEEPSTLPEFSMIDDDIQEIVHIKPPQDQNSDPRGMKADPEEGESSFDMDPSSFKPQGIPNMGEEEEEEFDEASDEEMFDETPEDTLKKTNELLDAEISKFIVSLKDTKQFKCSKCNYVTSFKTTIKRHIEAKHFITNGFPCDKCESRFKTRGSLKSHKSRKHKREPEFFATDYL